VDVLTPSDARHASDAMGVSAATTHPPSTLPAAPSETDDRMRGRICQRDGLRWAARLKARRSHA
jgi:hypothetical protein